MRLKIGPPCDDHKDISAFLVGDVSALWQDPGIVAWREAAKRAPPRGGGAHLPLGGSEGHGLVARRLP